MTTTRRQFITSSVAGGAALAGFPLVSYASDAHRSFSKNELQARFDKLDQVLKKPIFKKELFPDPVIIETLEILKYNGNYLCRVRSKDGAEGLSVGNWLSAVFIPVFQRNVQPFFLGQDARELELLLERVFEYRLNFRLSGMAVGIPISMVEFAILDMMGKIANKSAAQLIGDIHNREVGIYMATEFRDRPLDEHFARIKERVAQYDVKAIKIKVGFMVEMNRDIHYSGIPGKSEKLIPLVRKYYGDDWAIYADANGYYSVDEAIRIGRIMEENNYAYFEEPVMFNHFEEIKKVTQKLTMPIANGEQDQGFYNFRWLLAHDALDIVQPDLYYFGGFILSMKVALMGHALGKTCVPHISGGGLGFLYNALFVSALPNADAHHEFKSFKTDVVYECPTAPMEIVDGKMKAPSGPGMGALIDPEYVAKHQPI